MREGSGIAGEVHTHRFQYRTRLGASERDDSDAGGDGRHEHAGVHPFALQPFFHQTGDTRCTTGGGAHEEAVFRKARYYAVVDDHAKLVQHQAVTQLAHLQCGHGVAVEAVEEPSCIGPAHFNLAEWRAVEDAHALAHCQGFTLFGSVRVLAGLQVVRRAHPAAVFLQRAAVRGMPVVQCQATHRAEQLVALPPAESTHRHGRIGKAIACSAYGVRRAASHFAHVRQCVHVRSLALVRRHA